MNRLTFDNSFTRDLPADPETANYRRQVRGACYSRVKPTPVAAPELVAYSFEAAELLDLSPDICEGKEFTQIFSGNRLLPGMDPYAACYGGHQFGNWAGQLGDGRAINLGEIINKRSQRFTLQLKGAGPTPYSRNADGLAVLRSSVREFLCSEAMFHLGVPTTRALSLILTGEMVERDMFYDGHPKEEPGAVVCRLAPSFTRFGNFEIFASRNETGVLKKLLDYTIRTDFPDLGESLDTLGSSTGYASISSDDSKKRAGEGTLQQGKGQYQESLYSKVYIEWFEEVCRRTADMVVHWMRVGFVHGVMNTDNMSILGLTIDYGPYGWLENYDPDWTPNTTDASGRRYRFGNQPSIAHWNLAQLANAIYPVVGDVDALQHALSVYTSRFQEQWNIMVAAKLGFREFEPETDKELANELFTILSLVETDMTLFFRGLAKVDFSGYSADGRCKSTESADGMYKSTESADGRYKSTESIGEKSENTSIKSANSVKNLKLNSTKGDLLPEPLMYAYYVPEQLTEDFTNRMARWLKRYKQRIDRDNLPYEARRVKMNSVNPKYVLRNYLAQLAIDKAEQADFSMIHDLLETLRNPYSEQPDKESFAMKRPDWARHRPGCSMLSCSS
ncbi:MAG: YdiU family protein [Desulfamplus sp.]|nr:YdiU family protein [Desulfamplus sp.]